MCRRERKKHSTIASDVDFVVNGIPEGILHALPK